ncbi:transposase [Aliiruegeria lutimaris]|uniref:transposase n=1 Tax=Aliiruegeria lutimaris TaxID=571298 RepID=UPI000A8CDFF8
MDGRGHHRRHITATAPPASVPDPSVLKSGQPFAARLGLVTRQDSSSGKERLGRVSKIGNGDHLVLEPGQNEKEAPSEGIRLRGQGGIHLTSEGGRKQCNSIIT